MWKVRSMLVPIPACLPVTFPTLHLTVNDLSAHRCIVGSAALAVPTTATAWTKVVQLAATIGGTHVAMYMMPPTIRVAKVSMRGKRCVWHDQIVVSTAFDYHKSSR